MTTPALFDAIHAQVPAQTLRQAEHNRPFIAKTIRDLVGGAADTAMVGMDVAYDAGPAFYWYRRGQLELVRTMKGSRIVNATDGGILFGEGIEWRSLDQVMASVSEEGARP